MRKFSEQNASFGCWDLGRLRNEGEKRAQADSGEEDSQYFKEQFKKLVLARRKL